MLNERNNRKKPISRPVLIVSVAILLSLSAYFLLNQENDHEIETKVEGNGVVIVNFEDENLENYIRHDLGIISEDITSEDMLGLYSLSLDNLGVQSLKGLEYALELNSFSLSNENIESLVPIKNLSSLERLRIRYSVIENLPLEFGEDVNFIQVSIINTSVGDVSFLSGMTNLEHLTMTDADIEDISSLKGLNNINQLNLRGNSIEDISSLRGMDNLEVLNLQSNKVQDISPLSGLNKLYDLVLSFNPVYNLTPLTSLPSLADLVVYLEQDSKHLILDDVKVLEDMGINVEYTR